MPVARREHLRHVSGADRFALDTDLLKAVFHGTHKDDDDACMWSDALDRLPDDRLNRLAELVGLLCCRSADYSEMPITLDYARLRDGCEAWVPVTTPEGRAVLVWNNCD